MWVRIRQRKGIPPPRVACFTYKISDWLFFIPPLFTVLHLGLHPSHGRQLLSSCITARWMWERESKQCLMSHLTHSEPFGREEMNLRNIGICIIDGCCPWFCVIWWPQCLLPCDSFLVFDIVHPCCPGPAFSSGSRSCCFSNILFQVMCQKYDNFRLLILCWYVSTFNHNHPSQY